MRVDEDPKGKDMFVLLLSVLGALSSGPPVTLRALEGLPVNPYLFGYNAESCE